MPGIMSDAAPGWARERESGVDARTEVEEARDDEHERAVGRKSGTAGGIQKQFLVPGGAYLSRASGPRDASIAAPAGAYAACSPEARGHGDPREPSVTLPDTSSDCFPRG